MRCFYILIIYFAIFFNNHLFAKLSNGRRKRNAVMDENRLWPKAIVPYTIDLTFSASEIKLIEEAMDDIGSVSCIVFKKHTSESVYIKFLKGRRCHAPIGYIGQIRKLTLNKECITTKRIIHMLFHTLGFYHEHTRPDRDNQAIVHYENIDNYLVRSFTKKNSEKVNALGLPYDYNSILHYHDWAGAINPSLRTLEHIKGNMLVYSAGKMSVWVLDILKLNKLYRCSNNKMTVVGLDDDEGSGITDLEDTFITI